MNVYHYIGKKSKKRIHATDLSYDNGQNGRYPPHLDQQNKNNAQNGRYTPLIMQFL
jgi:hypothetical protein